MSKHSIIKTALTGSLICISLAGCGSSNSDVFTGNTGGTQGFTVTEPATVSRDGEMVDSVEIEAFDAQGNRLSFNQVRSQGSSDSGDHVVVPFGNTMTFPPLPPGTRKVELDYLRNGGYTLHRAVEDVVSGQTALNNPDEQPAAASTSQWQLKTSDGGDFTVDLVKSVVGEAAVESDFVIKGVCYSPCPINVLGDGAPNIGDFFFDPVVNPDNGQTDFFNWYGLWGKGALGDGYFARQDIDKIRDLGANTIRTYSMLSRQQNDKKSNPQLPEFPDPESVYHHQHKQFLDLCWNNGRDPIYVIVGIPSPADLMYLDLQGNTDKIKFYNFVLRETIADLKDHPAVLGFTTQNEINDGPNAYPNSSGGQMTADDTSTGAQNAKSDFYWGKVKEHSDYAKATAPDKLNGICVHDFREIAQYASNFPAGESYLEKASNLDFVGVNTYETINYNTQYLNGWGAVTGGARKALLFSELGFPATTRDGDDPKTLKDTPESRQKTADFIKRMLPQAYSNGVSIGACYFEFSDEWWKQPGNAVDEWYGGQPAGGFPNGWWDEEGFGLFSVARFPGLQNSDPVMVEVNGQAIGPDRRLDRLTERKEITSVVKSIFDSL